MRVLLFLLPALAILSACALDSSVPTKSVDDVMATFNDAIAGCTAGLTEDGAIDQAALAATGWQITKRTISSGGAVPEDGTLPPERAHPLDDYPALKSWEFGGEHEVTLWKHPKHDSLIDIARWSAGTDLADYCTITARVDGDSGSEKIVSALSKKFARKPDRQGVLPRGGDFLTPRSDKPLTGYYWAMSQNEVYLKVDDDGNLTLDMVAMPDRSKIEEYSSDHPERRIP